MPLLEWKDEYSVDIEEIDLQHKKIIELINILYEAMNEHKTKDVLEEIIMELTKYTVSHFAVEEQYFEKFGYVNAGSHKLAHKGFVDKVSNFKVDFNSGKSMLSMEILSFLKAWLIEHIVKIDREYTQCFKENGLK